MRSVVKVYIRFSAQQPNLRRLLFEHQLTEGKEPPKENEAKFHLLLGLMERALGPLFSPSKEAERLHVARVLWASLHGIFSLGSAGKFTAGTRITTMVETLVTHFLVGIRDEPVKQPA